MVLKTKLTDIDHKPFAPRRKAFKHALRTRGIDNTHLLSLKRRSFGGAAVGLALNSSSELGAGGSGVRSGLLIVMFAINGFVSWSRGE